MNTCKFFFIAISLVSCIISLSSFAGACSTDKITRQDCLIASSSILFYPDNTVAPGESSITVSQGGCLITITAIPDSGPANEGDVLRAIIGIFDANICSQPLPWVNRGPQGTPTFQVTISQTRDFDVFFGPLMTIAVPICGKSDKPLVLNDCTRALVSLDLKTQKSGEIITRGTGCEVHISTSNRLNVNLSNPQLFNLLSQINRQCNTNPGKMVVAGATDQRNGRMLLEVYYPASATKKTTTTKKKN